jgi:hypothetical protein
MSFLTRFVPHSAYLLSSQTAATWINQIESASDKPGVELFIESTGNEVDAQFVAVKSVMPEMALTTSDLTALATVGFSGLYFSPASGKPGLEIFGAAVPLGAVPAADSATAHLVCTATDGLIVPTSIKCAQEQSAKLDLAVHVLQGTTATYSSTPPVVWATASAITSGAGATANIYTLAAVKFTDGAETRYVQGLTNQGVNFGLSVAKKSEKSDGSVYPYYASIPTRRPTMEFSTKDQTLAYDVADGVSCTAFAMYFQNVVAGGQRTAFSSTAHICVSGTAGMLTMGSSTFKFGSSGDAAFTFTPKGVLSISTTSSIPTS